MIESMPLCFGAVTYHSQDSERCIACANMAQCSVSVQKTIQELKETLNVVAFFDQHKKLKAKTAKAPISTDQTRPQALETGGVGGSPSEPQSQRLSVNIVQETRNVIANIAKCATPTVIRQSLSEGRNPFSKRMPEAWLLSELVMKKAATKQNITAAFDRSGVGSVKCAAYQAAFVSLQIVESGVSGLQIKGQT